MHCSESSLIWSMSNKSHKHAFNQIIETAVVLLRFYSKLFYKFIIQSE